MTRLGVRTSVKVAKVNVGTAAFSEDRRGPSTAQLAGSLGGIGGPGYSQGGLAETLVGAVVNGGLVQLLPWAMLKETKKQEASQRQIVVLRDGTEFPAKIATTVIGSDGKEYPLGELTSVEVTQSPASRKPEQKGPVWTAIFKTDSAFQRVDGTAPQIWGLTSFSWSVQKETFRLKVGEDISTGNISDFKRIVVGADGKADQWVVQAQEAQPVLGTLVTETNGHRWSRWVVEFRTLKGHILLFPDSGNEVAFELNSTILGHR